MDKFYDKGMMGTYIKLRNSAGAGKIFCLIKPNLVPRVLSYPSLWSERGRESLRTRLNNALKIVETYLQKQATLSLSLGPQ